MPHLPVLVACSHGTRDPAGRAAVAALRREVSALLPDVEVRAAFLDVEEPGLDEVLGALARESRAGVVVPLLLSAGYHVHVDIAMAVQATQATASPVTSTPALGPDPAIGFLLAQRLGDIDAATDVLLAAAGSSDARALADVERTAADLGARLGRPVRAAYLAAARPSVSDAVATARERGRRVAVATYLLAPGHFARRLAACGADVVTPPLLPDPALAGVVAARYAAATSGG